MKELLIDPNDSCLLSIIHNSRRRTHVGDLIKLVGESLLISMVGISVLSGNRLS